MAAAKRVIRIVESLSMVHEGQEYRWQCQVDKGDEAHPNYQENRRRRESKDRKRKGSVGAPGVEKWDIRATSPGGRVQCYAASTILDPRWKMESEEEAWHPGQVSGSGSGAAAAAEP